MNHGEKESQVADNDIKKLKRQHEDLQERFQLISKQFEKVEKTLMAKNAFLANMSHDLRTPLHAILSYSRFGIDKIDRIGTEKITKYFRNIEESGKKLQEMLTKIVDLSKLESGKMKFQCYSSNLSLMIHALLEDHKDVLEEKQIKVDTDFSVGIESVLCDQNKIVQALTNIFENALDNSPENSTILITMKNGDQEKKFKEKSVVIKIQDQRQVAMDSLAVKNFEEYLEKEKTNPNIGIQGIDMMIAFEIVKFHNGTISVFESKAGGASFEIVLPIESQDLL